MGAALRRHGPACAAVVAVALAGAIRAHGADAPPVEQLLRELEAMKRRLAEVEATTRAQQKKIEQQDAVIRALQRHAPTATAGPPAPAAAPQPAAAPAKSETATADAERLQREITEGVMRRIQPSLAAANKTFPSQFNPAISLGLDNVASYGRIERGNFEFRSAELGLSASVDPFVRGYAFFVGSQDGFDVEEAAIVTTSLPYGLTVKGGRFFADFGRLSKFHDHDLPVVNRPLVLDRFVGGESQADGVETSWLAPTSRYLALTVGAYNKIGADNDRVSNTVPRDLSEFTYLTRAATFVSIADAHSLDLGASWAFTPQVQIERDDPRHLAGVDVTYRYSPLAQAGYRGLVWGTEALVDLEERPVGGFPADGTTPAAFRHRTRFGLYSYVEATLTRRFSPGFLLDWVQGANPGRGDSYGFSPYLSVWVSEFHRFRLEYTRLQQPGKDDDQFFLQWTVFLGSHVHGFRDR